MSKRIAAAALLAPGIAWAHGPGWVFNLIWWHLALLAALLGFLAFSSARDKSKLAATAGFILVPVIAWVALGAIRAPEEGRLSYLILGVFFVAPVAGFAIGVFLVRPNAPQQRVPADRTTAPEES